jgi:hypothetical protein
MVALNTSFSAPRRERYAEDTAPMLIENPWPLFCTRQQAVSNIAIIVCRVHKTFINMLALYHNFS